MCSIRNVSKHPQQKSQLMRQHLQTIGCRFETSEIVLRRKYWEESFVEHDEGEEDDGAGEPVEDVLKHLNGDRVGRESAEVNGGHVEVGNVGES